MSAPPPPPIARKKRRSRIGVVSLVVTLVALAVATLTGWYTATYYVGLFMWVVGWIAYAIVALVAMTLAIVALATGERPVLPIVCIALLVLGGPAACSGSLAYEGHCAGKDGPLSPEAKRWCPPRP